MSQLEFFAGQQSASRQSCGENAPVVKRRASITSRGRHATSTILRLFPDFNDQAMSSNSKCNDLLDASIMTCAIETFFDASYPTHERFPRRFVVEFRQLTKNGRIGVKVLYDGRQIGDFLTDNSHEDDGYRFHDVFHLSFAAVLGWSPMARTMFGCKRKSRPDVDEVEDGARSKILEEAICAIVFAYARDRAFLDRATTVDNELLSTIKSLTRGREVERRSEKDWESAILQSYCAWRLMRENQGGELIGDLCDRTITYR